MDDGAPWTRQTFGPIREAIALLAAGSATQREFVDGRPIKMPICELHDNLSDMVPIWLDRMVGDGVISQQLSDELGTFERWLLDLPPEAWVDELSVLDGAWWITIRERADQVLALIDAELRVSDQ